MMAVTRYPFTNANTDADPDEDADVDVCVDVDEDADEAIPIDRKSKYMLRIGAMA